MKKLLLLALLLSLPAHASRDFNGTTDLINCGSATILDDHRTVGFTISFWIHPDNAGEGNASDFVGKFNAALNTGWSFRFFSISRDLRFGFLGGTTLGRTTSTTVSTGVWTHILLAWDGSDTAANADIYINGVEASYATTTNGATLTDDSANDLLIGNRVNTSNTVDGRMADFAIWRGVVLSANEITSLAKGTPPAKIRSSSLSLYLPLWGASGTGNEPDLSGQRNACVLTGTTATASHSPVSPYAK